MTNCVTTLAVNIVRIYYILCSTDETFFYRDFRVEQIFVCTVSFSNSWAEGCTTCTHVVILSIEVFEYKLKTSRQKYMSEKKTVVCSYGYESQQKMSERVNLKFEELTYSVGPMISTTILCLPDNISKEQREDKS